MGVKERYEERQKNGNGVEGTGVKQRYLAKEIGNVASYITSRVNNWLQNHNNYISNYQNRYSSRKYNYEDAYVSDSGSWLDTVTQQKSKFDAEADSILSYMDQYKGYLDADWMKSVRDTLTGARDVQGKIINGATEDNKWWSGFGSEELVKQYGSAQDAYKYYQRADGYEKKYTGMTSEELYGLARDMDDGEEKDWVNSYASSVDYDERGKLDLNKAAQEIEDLGNLYDQAFTIGLWYDEYKRGLTPYDAQKIETYNRLQNEFGGDANAVKKAYEQKEQYLKSATDIQKLNSLSAVSGNEDFGSKSKYVSNVEYGLFGKPEFTDNTYAYINNPTVKDKRALGAGETTARALIGDSYRAYSADSPLRNRDSSYEREALEYIKPEEVAIYNYYYATEGSEKAQEYLNLLISTFQERKDADTAKKVSEFANAHPALSSALSVGTSLGSGFEYLEDIIEYGGDKLMGKDAKLGTNESALATNAVRSTVADKVDWEIGNWDAFDFLYNTTMSGVDSLASTAFGGLGGTVLGLSAAAQGTNDALARGMSDGQAFWNGLFSGVFEGVFESLSIGNFNKLKETAINVGLKNIDKTVIKTITKNLGKSMLVNASEEMLTELANITYDTLVNGEFANYTLEELFEKGQWKNALNQVIESGASGALMGMGMSALGSSIAHSKGVKAANAYAAKNYGGKTDAIIQEGLENDVKSNSYKLATKYQQQVQGKDGKQGKVLSGQQIRNLLAANQDQIRPNDLKKIQQAAEKRLTALGQTKDVAKVAELATKRATGQKLSRDEKTFLANSEYGARVANELLPENIDSEGYSTEWAEEIGTKQVNAKAYNKKAIRELIDAIANAEDPNAYKSLESRVDKETPAKVSSTGKSVVRGTGEEIDMKNLKFKKISEDRVILDVNGKDVDTNDIDFATEDMWNAFNAIKKIEHITPAVASSMIAKLDESKPIWGQLNGMDEAFTYGYYNYSEEDLKAGLFTGNLSKEQLNDSYKLGQYVAEKSNADKTNAYKAMRTAAQAEAEKAVAEGKEAPKAKKLTITYNEGGKIKAFNRAGMVLSDKQDAAVKVAEFLHKLGLGTNFEFFASQESKNMVDEKTGVPVRVVINEHGVEEAVPAGVYSKGDGTIRIDLNAYNGRGLALYSLAHELTHFIQQWSDEKYKVLAEFLVQTYEKTDMTMHKRVIAEQARLEDIRGKEVSYDEAYHEVVAKAMMKMFDDGKLAERLTELKAKDESLARKLWEGLKKFLAEFLGIYNSNEVLYKDTDDIVKMKDAFEQLQKLFAEALVEASENFQAAQQVGFEMDMGTESVSPAVMHSEQTWTESDYVKQRDKAAEEIAKAIGVSKKKAKDYIDSVNNIAKMIAEDRSRLDYFSSPGRSSFVDNAEYGGSFDFSTLCKKRRLLTGTFTAIQKALPNTALTANEILDIRNRMKEAGLEVSCGLCYVEGSRANMGQFAKEFIRLYKQYYPDAWQPNMADVNTPDGVEWVRLNHPECYEQYEYFWNHYGTLNPGDKNLFASQQKPKLYQLHTEYKGEILNKFKNDDKVEDKNLNGGIRLQSFSDFEIVHLIDTMQIIMDMSRVGLAGQAYTKVPDFAWALGDTGLKINLSLIAKGVDANGKLVFDDVEGMPIAEAMKLRDRYSKNVGTILVAFNDEQLLAAMADDRVDFIIPFHRSQWKKSQYEAMGLPAKTKDYTFMQNEKFIKPTFHEYRGRMVKDKATNYMPNEYWDFSKSGKENAEAYLEMCARNNKRPKFYKLLQNNGDGSYSLKADGSTDGYWKLLIDFKMYDNEGNGSPQLAVKPDFNMEEATRMLNDYSGGHSNFPVAQGIVDGFVKDYKASHKGEQYSSQETDADTVGYVNRSTVGGYDFTKSFLEQLSDFEKGVFPKEDTFLLGKTPDVLKKIGLASLPLTMTQTHIDYALNGTYKGDEERKKDHLMSKEDLAKIPALIANPVAIIQDKQLWQKKATEYSVDVLVEMEINGKKTLVPINVNSKGQVNGVEIDSNRVQTIHGNVDTVQRLINALNEDSDDNIAVFYINKEKAAEFLRPAGNPISSAAQKLDGFIHNVTDKGSHVKMRISGVTESQQFLRWFGNWMKFPENASKVVDEDGKPLIVYHGTSAKFTSFDTSNGRYGIYLTANKQLASSYGGNIMESYASIKNPKYIDAGYALAKTMDMSKIAREAEAEGYDGVIITNLVHAGNVNYDAALWELAPEAMMDKDYLREQILYIDETTGFSDKIYELTDVDVSLELFTNPDVLWKAMVDSGLMYDNRVSKQLKKLEPIQKEIASYVEQYNRAVEAIRKAESENANSIADTVYVAFKSGQVKDAHNNIGTFDGNNPDTLFSSQQTDADNAPIFYSKMGKVVEGMKQEKFGASSVISMLRGRGVKAEEIRWSGIHAFLDGKKSVTKQELLDFINGSMLHIEEELLDNAETGERGKLPNNYRLEETETDMGDPQMNLYIDDELVDTFELAADDSIQSTGDSDIWAMNEEDLVGQILNHYAGMGYDEAYLGVRKKTQWDDYKLDGGENYRELVFKMPGSTYSNDAMKTHWGGDAKGVLAHARVQDFDTPYRKILFIEEIQSDWHNQSHKNQNTPDAPFKETYHEYVLKRLLRMAAEEGYDSIGWTTADIQMKRWNMLRATNAELGITDTKNPDAVAFEEGYRIEYDQDIPKFLNKYGKQWGATVEKTDVQTKQLSEKQEADLSRVASLIEDGEGYIRDEKGIKEIWSMDITDAMKKSVLEEGQEMYSTQETDNISNRDMLANAFEGLSQNSDEYKMIQEYKGHIKQLNEYEEKLDKLNAEIRKMTFGEGGERNAQKLKQLQEEAKKVAKEINRHDKKLLSMEASEPLRKVIEQERKKAAQKTKAHVKEILQNKKTRAEQTELRHKIRKVVRDLDKILNRGNKKQNVKEDMKGFVSKALDLADYLFTDHITNDDLIRRGITVPMRGNEAQLVKETEDILTQLYDNADNLTDEEFTRLDAKRKSNLEKLRDLLTEQRNARLRTPVYQLFDDLVNEYASLKNSKQDAVKAAYNEELEKSLRAFMSDDDRVKILKNMRVADMTTEELNWLYRAYTMVLTNVRDANKFHVKGMNESIDQLVTQVVTDFGSRKIPDKKLAIALQKLSNKIGWDYEKLYYALDRIGSKAFTKLIMNLANSENIVMQDVMEAAAFRDEIVKKHGFNNWAVNKEIDKEFLDNTGKKFKLTLGQLMSLYAYSRRKGAWDHIEYGGFVFGEAALTNPKPADSYKLSKEQCEAITNTLTKEQKAYVEDMQKFLSESMGAKGNEVSMQLYGIKMFTEDIYFPIHIAGQFKAQAQESQAKAAEGFSSMSNAGFTHAQNPNAKAPFVLEGFNEVWVDHVNEMSRYHGSVPALEDIRRVMNRSSYSESTAESTSVKVIMENHFGKEAVAYFDNLYREANSGAIRDKLQGKPHKLLSLFRKNSVAYSLSVIIQQPASLVRAYNVIDRKYFGYKGFGTITSGVGKAISDKWTKAHTNAYNEMLKYAPGVTLAKEIGGFDTATGGSIRSYLLDTNKSLKQKWKTENALGKGKAVLDIVDDNAIANLPNVADKIAWIEIWNACKRETLATHKDLAPNSEEFMTIVGDRFTEVIRSTQVYDSIFAKSPMLKSKNLAVQYLVSFMNEPNTIANMAEKAVRDMTKGDVMSGLKTAHVVIHSIIFTNLLKSIIYAMRDDEEDETYIEKYIEAVTGNLMDDFWVLNYIPIARDVWSIAQGYDVERADMAIVADALDSLDGVLKNAFTDTDDMTEEQLIEFDKKVTESNWKLVESLAAFFGIPVKNIRREVNGVLDHIRIAYANAGQTTAQSAFDNVYDAVLGSIPFMQNKYTKQDKLYNATISGDKAYLERIKNTYKDYGAYQTAVRKALRENDSRIHDAAQAKYEGRTEDYKRIFREIQNEGYFAFDDIMSAINSEESAIRNRSEPDKVTSSYSASDFVESIVLGDPKSAQTIKEDILASKMANGKTQKEAEKEFVSNVSAGIRDAYSSGLLDEAEAEKMLMEYADKDEEEAASKVSYWVFCEEHKEYKDVFTESHVEKFHEYAEPADISVDVYAQFIKGTKGLTTIKDEWGDVEVTKKEQVLEFIDSLPLTWQQKDALYLAEGWAASKIYEAPWY